MKNSYFLDTKTEIAKALIGVHVRIRCGGVDCANCIFGLKNCETLKKMIDELKEVSDGK